jgi:hypothetical protein
MVQLADEFFLISWDTAVSGTPILHAQATSLGLAGALLGELVLLERLMIRGAKVWVIDRAPVGDALTAGILHLMHSAPEHSEVRTWLEYLARGAVDSVGRRLMSAGLVTRHRSRTPLRKHARYMATDFAKGAWPVHRVEMMLANRRRMTPTDLALVSLISATGLLDSIVSHSHDPHAARQYLVHVMATLPVPLRDLAGQVEAAVGDAVLSYRS